MQSLMTISIPLKYANTALTNMNSLITLFVSQKLVEDDTGKVKRKYTYLAYFAKPEMAYTYLAEYNSGAVVPEHMKYSDSPTFAEMYEKWKKYRKSLKNKISDSHGEIMRLLFIISVNCMTANLFPSGQMICSNA